MEQRELEVCSIPRSPNNRKVERNFLLQLANKVLDTMRLINLTLIS